MFTVFNDIIAEMRLVYQHDQRPWMLGFSGGKILPYSVSSFLKCSTL